MKRPRKHGDIVEILCFVSPIERAERWIWFNIREDEPGYYAEICISNEEW